MLIDLGTEIYFDNCYLGLATYNTSPNDTLRSVVCGSKNMEDNFNYISYALSPTWDGMNFTCRNVSENVGFRSYRPDMKLGISG